MHIVWNQEKQQFEMHGLHYDDNYIVKRHRWFWDGTEKVWATTIASRVKPLFEYADEEIQAQVDSMIAAYRDKVSSGRERSGDRPGIRKGQFGR